MLKLNEIYNEDCLVGMKKIDDKSIDLILQDPPYNMTACKWEWDIMTKIDEFWAEWKRIIKDNGAIVLFGSEPFSSALRMSNIKNYKYDWVWDRCNKSNFLNAKHQPMRHIERISVFYKKKCTYNPILKDKRKDQIRFNNIKSNKTQPKTTGKLKGIDNRFDSRIIPLDKDYPTELIKFALPSVNKGRSHPTQKPVALMEYLIKTYTNEGDIVFDGFIGSGTTAVACINTNRNYLGFEIDETYFTIAQQRIKEAKMQLKLF